MHSNIEKIKRSIIWDGWSNNATSDDHNVVEAERTAAATTQTSTHDLGASKLHCWAILLWRCRRSTKLISQVTAKGDPPGNAWAPCVRHPAAPLLYTWSCRLVPLLRSSRPRFHVFIDARRGGDTESRAPQNQERSNRHYSEYKLLR
jgi:hypothetical protein